MHEPKNRETKYLTEKHNTDTYLPVRATGPLQEPMPFVIELRVVGTPAILQVQVVETMLIGRADPQKNLNPAVDLTPHNGQGQGVSRQHAAILVKDNRTFIKDLGSVNGTRLNGSLLAPQAEYRLRHGDELTIGHLKLQVRFIVVPTLGKTTKGTGSLESPVPRIAHGETALVVEGDASVAKVFSMALRHAGFEVTVVENAATAISHMAHGLPHLLVLELLLPDMNGLDLLRHLRKQAGNEKTRAVVCSGSTGGFQMHQAIDGGAQLFLGKPVSVEDLLKAAQQVLNLTTTVIEPVL
ncbi:MAG: response regulator [Chloroflexi bacterium]|nr:response regulator [Chloroflexota bacterium]MCC6896284.1 response regulator [Anaerolineae bacterium]